ncbi:MAG: hypothetical protein AAF206_04720 [Bacteroidota bacterium]
MMILLILSFLLVGLVLAVVLLIRRSKGKGTPGQRIIFRMIMGWAVFWVLEEAIYGAMQAFVPEEADGVRIILILLIILSAIALYVHAWRTLGALPISQKINDMIEEMGTQKEEEEDNWESRR